MSTLGFQEITLIGIGAFLLFVVFGPKNLPKLGKMFGSTMKEVRKGMSEFNEEMSNASDEGGDAAPVAAPVFDESDGPVAVEPGRKIAQVIYEDELEQPVIDPDRKVAKVIYEDEVE